MWSHYKESMILTSKEYQQILKGWLPADLEDEWHFLFQASQHDFATDTFKTSKRDNKGPTITTVKSGEYILGGFTEET